MVQPLIQQATAHGGTGITNSERLVCIRDVVAGGVRSMRAQAIPVPLVAQWAEGDQIRDVEGRELIDLNIRSSPRLPGYSGRELCAVFARPWFLSTVHSAEDLDHVLAVMRDVLDTVPVSQ